MIGTKNFWANALIFLVFICAMLGIYTLIKDSHIEYKITVWIGIFSVVSSVILTVSNRISDRKQKEIEGKASKEELNKVDKKVDDYIFSNRETNIRIENKIDLILEKLAFGEIKNKRK